MRDTSFKNAIIVASTVALIATVVAVLSWNLFEFDRALFIYAQALIMSLALTAYRLTVWLHRPPTLVMFQQAFRMLRNPASVISLTKHLGSRIFNYFALNKFVWRRGLNRWGAHWPIMIGCLMALGIVVPLIFGWVWFETPSDDLHSYKVMLFGQHIRTIPVDGIEAFLAFHGLVWASFPVIIGCSVALYRRLTDRGDQATQTWGHDLAPLVCLLAIAVSGLLMTVSYSFLGGALHTPVTWFHCFVVCGTLIWLPYSKLFHIPQRSLKLAHMIYEHEAANNVAGKAHCTRCGGAFADTRQIEDLIDIERQLGYRYELDQDEETGHYQSICPRCRRATLVIAQGKRWQQVAG